MWVLLLRHGYSAVSFFIVMRKIEKKYKNIANKLIASRDDLKDIIDFGVRIVYLSSDKEKRKNGKIVFADCAKVKEEYEWAVHYDFMITVYEPNIEGFTKRQIEILMLHELMHVGINCSGEEPKFYVVPHDIEEFNAIIDEFGIDWQRGENIAER